MKAEKAVHQQKSNHSQRKNGKYTPTADYVLVKLGVLVGANEHPNSLSDNTQTIGSDSD